MRTNVELGYNSIETAIVHADKNRRQRLTEGLDYLRMQMPKYLIRPEGHTVREVKRFHGTWPQHIFDTVGMGGWQVTVIDPIGLFNRATLTPAPEISHLAGELAIAQDFIKPPEYDKHAQEHTSVQLFLAANTRKMVESIFCNMGAAPPKHIAPFILEPGHGPDIVMLTPDPFIVEIGKEGKFPVLEEYIKEFQYQYPYVADRVTGAVVYYKKTKSGASLNVFSSRIGVS